MKLAHPDGPRTEPSKNEKEKEDPIKSKLSREFQNSLVDDGSRERTASEIRAVRNSFLFSYLFCSVSNILTC